MTHVFIVFHSRIFDELYTTIPSDVLLNNFTFVAVNPSIQKTYTQNKYRVLNEWELPVYNPDLQNLGYRENSVLYHVYANNLHKNYTKVGFFQYDMSFVNLDLDKYLHNSNPRLCFTHFHSTYKHAFEDTWWVLSDKYRRFILDNYEDFHKSKIDKGRIFPLFNSFIVNSDVFEKFMKWIIQLYAPFYTILENPSGYIAGVYERVTSLALSQQDIEFEHITDMVHDQDIKNKAY